MKKSLLNTFILYTTKNKKLYDYFYKKKEERFSEKRTELIPG
jgi:hypothetical protein